jgi:hypothetical protein
LAAGLIIGGLTLILWVLAVMTIATSFHRLYAVRQRLGAEPRPGDRP